MFRKVSALKQRPKYFLPTKSIADTLSLIRLEATCKIIGLISRHEWSRLYFVLRGIDYEGKGRIKILIQELLSLMKISKSSFYRWLKMGKNHGAFRNYQTVEKNVMVIYLGSKEKIAEKFNIRDWGSVTEIPLWMMLKIDEKIPLWKYHQEKAEELKRTSFRKRITQFQTQFLQEKSVEAAKEAEREKIKVKKKRKKPYDPRFCRAMKPETSTLLIRAARRPQKFSRTHLQTGATQEKIGNSLGISDRTVRRHTQKTERQQVYYKVDALEGQEELFLAAEEWGNPSVFYRKGEYFKFGPNLYNLNYTQKSEFTQKLKYKFNLYQKISRLPEKKDKLNLSIDDLILNTTELEKEIENFLDRICVDIFLEYFCTDKKDLNFSDFRRLVSERLREQKRHRRRNASKK